jgi:hypothetical protein
VNGPSPRLEKPSRQFTPQTAVVINPRQMQNMQNLHGNAESAFRSRNSRSKSGFPAATFGAGAKPLCGECRQAPSAAPRPPGIVLRRRTATGLQMRMRRLTTCIVFDF